MAHEYEDSLVLHRLNGGRLSVRDGSLVDGKHIIVTRYSAYDKTYPQRWNTVKVGEDEYGNDIIRIEQSNQNGTFRVDVGSDDPEADASRSCSSRPTNRIGRSGTCGGTSPAKAIW